jgi:hypothetical protein
MGKFLSYQNIFGWEKRKKKLNEIDRKKKETNKTNTVGELAFLTPPFLGYCNFS